MKKRIQGIILALFAIAVVGMAQETIRQDVIKFGRGAGTDKDIEADQGLANNPKIRYNDTSSKWEISNDGSAFDEIAAGAISIPDSPNLLANLGLASSVAASALTIDLKQADGSTDATAGSPVKIAFRDVTQTDGGFNVREVTGALTLTVPSGATLGHVSAAFAEVYIWAIDNAGTVELAVSGGILAHGADRISTTALSAASDSRQSFYSTSARTDVPVRYIGRLIGAQATAGTWASAADHLVVGGPHPNQIVGPYPSSTYITYRIGAGAIAVAAGTPTADVFMLNWVNSITDVGVGNWTLNLKPTFQDNIYGVRCTCSGQNSPAVAVSCNTYPVGAGQVGVSVFNSGGSATDDNVFLTCIAIR